METYKIILVLSENKVPFLLLFNSSQRKRGLFLYGISIKHSPFTHFPGNETIFFLLPGNNSDSPDLLDGGGAARRGEGVPEDEDDGVAPEEHLGDEPVLVDRLGFFLSWRG